MGSTAYACGGPSPHASHLYPTCKSPISRRPSRAALSPPSAGELVRSVFFHNNSDRAQQQLIGGHKGTAVARCGECAGLKARCGSSCRGQAKSARHRRGEHRSNNAADTDIPRGEATRAAAARTDRALEDGGSAGEGRLNTRTGGTRRSQHEHRRLATTMQPQTYRGNTTAPADGTDVLGTRFTCDRQGSGDTTQDSAGDTGKVQGEERASTRGNNTAGADGADDVGAYAVQHR